MRFNIPVYFQQVESTYNADTGNYDDVVVEDLVRADVTDTGTEMLKLAYNDIKQASKTIRLQQPYCLPFSSIRIGDKKYRVDIARRQKVFVVSEVKHNG